MKIRPAAPRGFTLIELMIVVAIIGILSSVAIPKFARAQIRARVAERGTVLEALARGINDTLSATQKMPDPATPTSWVGLANPPGALSTSKRAFSYSMSGWTYLPVIVQGSCYYSYSFQVSLANMWTNADGDLDGDGTPSSKTFNYTARGWTYLYSSQNPVAGAEDLTTF